MRALSDILNLDLYPLGRPESDSCKALVARMKRDWDGKGAFRLPGLMRPSMAEKAAQELMPLMESVSFRHCHHHNIYFTDDTEGLPPDLAAQTLETSHRTLTCDQMKGSLIRTVYEWEPLCTFLRTVLNRPHLYRMADPLACLNVMAYTEEEGLNWHFDRAEFAVTLLLQASEKGGEFEYVRNIRSAEDPHYPALRSLLRGECSQIRQGSGQAGDMTVFAGLNSAHRVAPVKGKRARMMAVFSFMEEPDYHYGAEDRIRFYGRVNPVG